MRNIKNCIVYHFLLIVVAFFSVNKNIEAQNPEIVKIGMLNLMTGGIVNMAKEKGFFSDNNIDLQILTFGSAQEIAIAVAAGDIDIGLSGFTAAVYNLAVKDKLKVIAGSSKEVNGWPGSAYVVTNKLWEKGVRVPSQLKDLSLGITEIGSTFHYMAGMLADKYEFSLEEKIKIIPFGSVLLIKSALISEHIDSAILPDVVAHKLHEEGNGHIIGYVGDETPWQVTGVFASTKLLKQNIILVNRFLTAYAKGCNYYHNLFNTTKPELFSSKELLSNNPEREKVAFSIANYVKPKVSPVQISTFPVYIDSSGSLDIESVEKQIKWYRKRSMIDKNVTFDKAVDQSIINIK